MNEEKMNEKKFRELFELYFEPICHFLNLYTRNKDIIEDVVQEVFSNLWINRDFLQIRHVRSYLYTAARNRILNQIRNEKLHNALLATWLDEEKELHEAYECLDKDEFITRLESIIDDLPPKCKTVFMKSRFNNMSYREIASEENISEKMVEKHISSALKKIRQQVKKMPFILL